MISWSTSWLHKDSTLTMNLQKTNNQACELELLHSINSGFLKNKDNESCFSACWWTHCHSIDQVFSLRSSLYLRQYLSNARQKPLRLGCPPLIWRSSLPNFLRRRRGTLTTLTSEEEITLNPQSNSSLPSCCCSDSWRNLKSSKNIFPVNKPDTSVAWMDLINFLLQPLANLWKSL